MAEVRYDLLVSPGRATCLTLAFSLSSLPFPAFLPKNPHTLLLVFSLFNPTADGCLSNAAGTVTAAGAGTTAEIGVRATALLPWTRFTRASCLILQLSESERGGGAMRGWRVGAELKIGRGGELDARLCSSMTEAMVTRRGLDMRALFVSAFPFTRERVQLT
jgi:hypothetical protein